MFGKRDKTARAAFSRFIGAGQDEGERKDLTRGTDGGRLLGGANFARKALKPAKKREPVMTVNQLIKVICKHEGIKESDLRSDSRARRESQIRQTAAYLATELEIGSLTAMAERFNRDLTTMSRNQRYFRDRLEVDKELARQVKRMKRLLTSGSLLA